MAFIRQLGDWRRALNDMDAEVAIFGVHLNYAHGCSYSSKYFRDISDNMDGSLLSLLLWDGPILARQEFKDEPKKKQLERLRSLYDKNIGVFLASNDYPVMEFTATYQEHPLSASHRDEVWQEVSSLADYSVGIKDRLQRLYMFGTFFDQCLSVFSNSFVSSGCAKEFVYVPQCSMSSDLGTKSIMASMYAHLPYLHEGSRLGFLKDITDSDAVKWLS
ncbi:MAG: hypothetical protein NDI94_00995 [Candidatus Woesearchaeota archaeon]|nr:hypothetical protein [Candidatus Woesearchaeota archaeon]